MIQTKTLYSLDKKGNPLMWKIKWDDNDNWFTMSSGRVDGAVTETKPTYCKAKNIGKSNETTDITQCKLEVEARIEKQIKKGFSENIPSEKRFEVSLAKEFSARKKFITFPLLLSAKLDGFRCYITKDGMFSRTHHQILSCPHILEDLQKFFKCNPDYILDGELYCHELKNDFNKIASLISRTKNIDEDFLTQTRNIIKFHIFDAFSKNNSSFYEIRIMPFVHIKNDYKLNDSRPFLSDLKLYFRQPSDDTCLTDVSTFDTCKAVNQYFVSSFEEIEKYMDLSIKEGFEGVMLRNPKMLYDEGRTSNLIKYKRFKDAEYEVIDIADGLGNHEGQAATITCKTESGDLFAVGLGKGWDEKAKRDLFENKTKYFNKKATIVYQELTPDNIPRFGKLLRFLTEI